MTSYWRIRQLEREHEGARAEGGTLMSNTPCNEIISTWDGRQRFVCLSERGTEHTHADAAPDTLRPVTDTDIIITRGDCQYLEDGERPYDVVNAIIEFESGEMEAEQVIELFQYLVNTGMAWTLQGSYGRMAAALLEQGHILPAGESEVQS